MSAPTSITVFTRHQPGGEPGRGCAGWPSWPHAAGVTLRVPPEEVDKHDLTEPMPGVELGADPDGPTDLAVALGGDGTILAALRRYAGREVPVFAINFGEIGFLSTVERDGLDDGVEPALRGDFEVLPLPALEVGDVVGAVARRQRHLLPPPAGPARRRAELRGARRADRARSAATAWWSRRPPARRATTSPTAGPVMAWGVEGFVVSFIAPHTLIGAGAGGRARRRARR